MRSEIFFDLGIELKGLLITGIPMAVGLALSLFFTLRAEYVHPPLSVRLSGVIGIIGSLVGNTFRSISYHDLHGAMAYPIVPSLLMLIIYAAMMCLCTSYAQYRRRDRDPAFAPVLIRDLVFYLLLIAAASAATIVVRLYGG